MTAKLVSLAQAGNLPLQYAMGGGMGGQDLSMTPRNGEPANMHLAAQGVTNAQLQAVMRGSSAFSQLPFPQTGMLGFGGYGLPQTPPTFDMLQGNVTPTTGPQKNSSGEFLPN